MRHPSVLIYEGDARLENQLRPTVEQQGWTLTCTPSAERCFRWAQGLSFAQEGTAVLVLRLGRDLERELLLLDRVRVLAPEVAVVVVGDQEHPGLMALAWDLGASCVLLPPLSRDLLTEVVLALLQPV